MSTELATRGTLSTNIEQVLLAGDLAKLTPDERLNYYNTLCLSLGLNPLTQPFQYIVLNCKLQLYAKKDCTEQLRKIHGVSITNVDPKQIGNLFVVVASASDRDGRVDSATGAVNMEGLKGEALANAMMKTETKAKRRVTLSICGLGMLDETEVQTLREQGVATEPAGNKWEAPNRTEPAHASQEPGMYENPTGAGVQGAGKSSPSSDAGVNSSAISHDDGEPVITPRSRKGAQPSTQSPPTQPAASQGPAIKAGEVFPPETQGFEPPITIAQRKFLGFIQGKMKLTDAELKAEMVKFGLDCSRDDIPKARFTAFLNVLDPSMQFHK